MSNPLPINSIQSHSQILRYPKGGKSLIAKDEWQVWDNPTEIGSSSLFDLASPKNKMLLPFHWWRGQLEGHQHEADKANILATAKNAQMGVWFAADDDILKHADMIEQGKQYWPLVAVHFPLFRDGRGFSTAALLRNRFGWNTEIRMIGDVLIDQLLQGARVGFDSFALRSDQDLTVALKQFDLFTVTTQNSWRDKRSILATQLA